MRKVTTAASLKKVYCSNNIASADTYFYVVDVGVNDNNIVYLLSRAFLVDGLDSIIMLHSSLGPADR